MTATAELLTSHFGTEIGRRLTYWLLPLTLVAVVLIWGLRTLNRGLALP
jgi:hypothetical protein